VSKPVAAIPERLSRAWRPPRAEPIWLVHGPGVNDAVVGHDFCVRTVEEMLLDVPNAAVYGRSAYSSFRRLVCCDAESRRLTR